MNAACYPTNSTARPTYAKDKSNWAYAKRVLNNLF